MTTEISTVNQQFGASIFPVDEAARWYVLQTKLRQEARVITHLGVRACEVDSFLPKIEVVRRHAGRRMVLYEPLFPSYLFLHMPLTPEIWNAVRWTPGARRVLGDDYRPIEMPQAFIEEIRERIRPLGFIRVGMNPAPGSRVRVRSGPFAGLEGIFERPTSRRDRVRVLLEILGKPTPLEIEIFDLERA